MRISGSCLCGSPKILGDSCQKLKTSCQNRFLVAKKLTSLKKVAILLIKDFVMEVVSMQAEELRTLAMEIRRHKTEKQNVELKAAAHGCPTRLFDTLSSFSNQDQGGIILFGIDESDNYRIVGVYDPQDLQKKVTEQCKQMEPSVRALFTVCEIDGKIIVSAEIPGVDIAERPVYYKGVGRIKGSYIRVGESDELMSEYEVYSYDAFRKRIRDDLRVVEDARMELFDKERLDRYLEAVKQERKNLADHVSDEEILELMGVTNRGIPTLAGLMVFSIYPQTYFPQLCITAVVVPGTEIGSTGEDGERFIDNKRITGPIPDMLKEAIDFVRTNSRTKSVIGEDGLRHDKDEYPAVAVREAILNAMVHRDYSSHTENVPIRIEMYRDRMEIKNSGGLYGRITIDSLGKVRPETRNAALANILELLRITENRYSGIPTIRTAFREAGLPAPVFSVLHGEFKVVFKNNIFKTESTIDKTNLAEAILEFCEQPRSRAELVEFTGLSRFYTMSTLVRPLVDQGKLRMTMPEKPKSSKQRFVRA